MGSATALKDLIDIPVLRIDVNLRYMCCESFEVSRSQCETPFRSGEAAEAVKDNLKRELLVHVSAGPNELGESVPSVVTRSGRPGPGPLFSAVPVDFWLHRLGRITVS